MTMTLEEELPYWSVKEIHDAPKSQYLENLLNDPGAFFTTQRHAFRSLEFRRAPKWSPVK